MKKLLLVGVVAVLVLASPSSNMDVPRIGDCRTTPNQAACMGGLAVGDLPTDGRIRFSGFGPTLRALIRPDGTIYAQEKPAPAVPASSMEKKPPVELPTVAHQDQQALSSLLYRAQLLQEVVALLQKEVDSTNAEVSRLLARLQKPEFDLARDPQTGRLVYLKREAEKKESPK